MMEAWLVDETTACKSAACRQPLMRTLMIRLSPSAIKSGHGSPVGVGANQSSWISSTAPVHRQPAASSCATPRLYLDFLPNAPAFLAVRTTPAAFDCLYDGAGRQADTSGPMVHR